MVLLVLPIFSAYFSVIRQSKGATKWRTSHQKIVQAWTLQIIMITSRLFCIGSHFLEIQFYFTFFSSAVHLITWLSRSSSAPCTSFNDFHISNNLLSLHNWWIYLWESSSAKGEGEREEESGLKLERCKQKAHFIWNFTVFDKNHSYAMRICVLGFLCLFWILSFSVICI